LLAEHAFPEVHAYSLADRATGGRSNIRQSRSSESSSLGAITIVSATFLFSIMLASLIGSPHCAGMCGPFMVLACGTRGGSGRVPMIGYHLGRLTTYLVLATLAGVFGHFVTRTGDGLGVSRMATMLAGGGMIVAGVIAVLRLRGVEIPHPRLPKVIVTLVPQVFRTTARWPVVARAYAVGLATTWLPCGWLYAFVLVAAGAGYVAGAVGVMLAFWVGTLPLLSVVAWGTSIAGERWRAALPWVSAAVMLATGTHLLVTRAHAQIGTVASPAGVAASPTERLDQARTSPLPCCHAR
jgi:uncharacterized protein